MERIGKGREVKGWEGREGNEWMGGSQNNNGPLYVRQCACSNSPDSVPHKQKEACSFTVFQFNVGPKESYAGFEP